MGTKAALLPQSTQRSLGVHKANQPPVTSNQFPVWVISSPEIGLQKKSKNKIVVVVNLSFFLLLFLSLSYPQLWITLRHMTYQRRLIIQ